MQGRVVRSVGKGILGSSDEVKNRKIVDWKEGSVFLYPSNGGKSIGWINELDDSEKKSLDINSTAKDVALYVVKVTPESI